MPIKKRKTTTFRGGIFDSPPWNFTADDKTKIRRAYSQIWGRLTTDPYTGVGNSPFVDGPVPFAKTRIIVRKGVTIDVQAYGDTQAQKALASARKGDAVFILGQREHTLFFSKRKQQDYWEKHITAAFVVKGDAVELLHRIFEIHEKIDIGLPSFLLFLWDKFKDEARDFAENYEKPDEWESG